MGVPSYNILNVMDRELRIACTVAQMEREGGISPRLSPLAQVSFKCFFLQVLFLGYTNYENFSLISNEASSRLNFVLINAVTYHYYDRSVIICLVLPNQ